MGEQAPLQGPGHGDKGPVGTWSGTPELTEALRSPAQQGEPEFGVGWG